MEVSSRMEEVREVLSEYAEVASEEEKLSFFKGLAESIETQKCLLSFLQCKEAFRSGSQESIKVLELLFYAYRSLSVPDESSNLETSSSRRLLVLQYLPCLLALYLEDSELRSSQALLTLLLTIYNSSLEALSPGFRLPALTQSSLFHDASRIEVNEMRAWKSASVEADIPSHSLISRVTAQSRPRLLSGLLRLFNIHLASYPQFILVAFAETYIRILRRGFPKRPNATPQLRMPTRIRLSGSALLEILHGGYFCFYNDLQRLGSALVDSVHFRGIMEANPSVLSAAGAAKSLLLSQGGTIVSVSTPTFSQIAKNMITNASFRTKKMGDDIPVVESEADGGGGGGGSAPPQASDGKALASISEENGAREEEAAKQAASSSSALRTDLKEKLISKLPLKKKSKSAESNNNNNNEGSGLKVAFSKESSSSTSGVTGSNTSVIIPLSQPVSLNTSSSGPNGSEKNKLELLLLKKKAATHYQQNNGEVHEIDSLEQVEELIKRKNLPPETITIHSPESGTTLF